MRNHRFIMKKLAVACALFALAIAAGCVQSLHPLYTDEDIVFKPALVGTWDGDGSGSSWQFAQAGENAYTLVFTDENGRTGAFDAHLANINGRLFLDFFPQEPEIDTNDFYMLHILPVHTFALVELSEEELKMSVIDPNWLDELLAEDPGAIKHEIVMELPVFTASTKELQAFVTRCADTDGAFSDPMNLKRITEEPS